VPAQCVQIVPHPGYSVTPLVSSDFNHNPASATFDATLTKVAGRLVKVAAWYDNEWGFANRMLDTAVALNGARRRSLETAVTAPIGARGTMAYPETSPAQALTEEACCV